MTTMKKHFVDFFSPGTFVPEETTREIPAWDVDAAVKMAGGIVERYNARPFAFQFFTRERGDDDFNSKEVARSKTYHLGGRVETLAEIEARNDPKEETLRFNMRANDWNKIVINDNSWRSTQPLRDGDVVLDVKLPKPKKSKAA